ncbi:hypothetical protein DPEC_G00038400 [Dallia pectoralis]|uniref:Uncharacterized protein n=1 Tax=Dallia pectoralis TaxID=75939 RepID=A0ACC2HFI6_DALPE|nr:hypothetical protein DPEC_G00038400 [Dallia pectoralis]
MTFPQTKLLASPLLHFTTRETSFSLRAFFASLSAASLPSTPTCAGTHANLTCVSSTSSTRSFLLRKLQDCKLFRTVHESEKTTTPPCTFSSTHCKANSTAINSDLQVYYWTWPHPHRTLCHGHRGTKFYSPKAQLPGPGITYPPQTHRLALSMFPANLQNFLSRKTSPIILPLRYCYLTGTSLKLPLEVGMQLMASRPPACDHIVELLDWFDEPDYIIIVMEHPFPCMDLIGVTRHITCGAMREDYARRIWQQAVLACRQCRDRGVLHRDVKAENLLLQLDTFRVKLVDFGCSDLLQEELYSEYCGTLLYCPPEMLIEGTYGGDKATVWSLGVLLYGMVNANLPFRDEEEICSGDDFPFKAGLSDECRDLIKWCLRLNANCRPSFEDILQHEWFQGPQH